MVVLATEQRDKEHPHQNQWPGHVAQCGWANETSWQRAPRSQLMTWTDDNMLRKGKSWRGHPDLNQWPGHVQNSGEGWGSGQQCKICDGGNGWTSRRSGDGGGCCKCSWNSGDGMVVVVELEEDVVMVVWWWRWWSNGWWRVGGQNSCGGGIVGGGKGMN